MNQYKNPLTKTIPTPQVRSKICPYITPLTAMLKYIIRKTKRIVLLLFTSFLIWGFLATYLEQSSFALNEIPSSLINKKIQLLIAHPDDEVMFFAPSIIELSKPKYGNEISLTCYSTGNDQGLGKIRSDELARSLEILGLKKFDIINDESQFKDSMELEWDAKDIVKYISDDTDVILTFDDIGISNHPNHKSLYKGAIESSKPVFSIKSWNFAEKYSSTLYTNIQIITRLFNRGAHLLIHHLKPYGIETYLPTRLLEKLDGNLHGNIHIFADLPSTILGVAAMSNAHQSQMVWFRWGWLSVSKYGNSNELIQVV